MRMKQTMEEGRVRGELNQALGCHQVIDGADLAEMTTGTLFPGGISKMSTGEGVG